MRASLLVFTLILAPVALLATPLNAQDPSLAEKTAETLMRQVCKNPDMQKAGLDKIEADSGKREREITEWDMRMECGRIDLPSKPVNDTADPAPDATHTDWIYDARYSPDGRSILSASRDGSIRVWDAASGKPVLKVIVPPIKPLAGEPDPVYVRLAIFIGDGSRIAIASDKHPVRIVETATGKTITDIPFATIMPDETFPPKMASTSKGLLFLAGAADEVLAIDTATNAVRYKLPGHKPNATAVAVSEAAGLVATGAEGDGKFTIVRLWKLETGAKVVEFKHNGSGRPDAIAFSSDGAQMAVAYDGIVVIYAVADKREVQTIIVHPMFSVFDVAFTADGKGLISCQRNPVLWDIATAQIVRQFGPFGDLCHAVDVSPDGKFAVTGSMGSDVRVWEISTGTFDRRIGTDVHPPR